VLVPRVVPRNKRIRTIPSTHGASEITEILLGAALNLSRHRLRLSAVLELDV
jgi:hypothetical protein